MRFRSLAWFLVTLVLGLCSVAPSLADTPNDSPNKDSFEIREFVVLGTHLLPPVDIERAVYAFLGPDRTLATVKAAADAVEKTYKDAGYGTVFVDIPEQDVTDGVVRLKVTEGHLEGVHVRGERYFSGRQILAALPALKPGDTPQLPALQRELTELNARTPDRSVTPILKAGSEPGTVAADLSVKDTLPLHGSLSFDDRHTADTTPNRLTAALSYDNLWQRQDSVALQYQTAPARPSDAEVLIANYLAHLDADGALAAFSYIRTNSNVLAVGTLGVLGKGSIYGAHWIEPIEASPARTQSVNFGVDYKDVLTQVFPDATGSASGAPVTAAVRYLNWSATYSSSWYLPAATLGVNAGFAFGVQSILNSSSEFENARYNANPDYFYVRLGFNGTENLPAGFAISERLNGQWSDDPLVNNEQFSLGGVDTVRGYLEAETLGDSGLAGSIELHSPRVGPKLGPILSPLYALVFVDGGVASLVDPLGGQRPDFVLWSTGVGLRLENARGLAGSLDYAIPQRDGVRTLRDHRRIDFSLRYGF